MLGPTHQAGRAGASVVGLRMAIQLKNSFVLDMPLDQAWALLSDVERIAPCVPGARLTEVEGQEYRGSVKLKLGPISAEYRGAALIKEADAVARRMVVEGQGRDVHGQGSANAVMVVSLAADGAGSRVEVATEVQVAGKMAQLGASMMQEVAARLIDQFVANLREIRPQPAEAAPTLAPSEPAPQASDTSSARHIESAPPAQAIDLLDLSKAPAVRRGLVIAAIVIVAAAAILLLMLRR